jgi:purine-nucleoside phosphorylase
VTESEFPMDRAMKVLRDRLPETPEVFLVLGSGLGALAGGIDGAVKIPFGEVPGFPEQGVEGHAGYLIGGRVEGHPVLFQAGRFHLYEGYDPSVVVAPVRLAARLGAKIIIVTNAAGSLVPDLVPGSILLLTDHINLMARNPLAGQVQPDEERFPDMSAPFDEALQELAADRAETMGLELPRGTYVGVLGPCYETPAEVRFLQKTGAQAVGMSTVPEVIAARALGLRVLAFSLITNLAAGLGNPMGNPTLHHGEVLEVGAEAGSRLKELIRSVLAGLDSTKI